MDLKPISRILTGKFSPKSLGLYILINYSLAIAFLITATVSYHFYDLSRGKDGFSFLWDDISATGSISGNAPGWIYFSIFLWYAALLMVPINFYFLRRMKQMKIPAYPVIVILYFIGTIGNFLVGCFPSGTIREGHLTSAILAFSGYLLGFIIFFFSILVKKYVKLRNSPEERKKMNIVNPLFLPYILLFAIVIGVAITQGHVLVDGIANIDDYRGTIQSISLWEWSIFFTIVIMFISFAIIFSRIQIRDEK
ncbi:MAG: hypothetical protein ACFFCS_23050 [Candidatus Hodarchaeota archaeon]